MVRDLGHDGARVVIKRFIQCEQLNAHGTKLQNVEDVNFLCANISYRLESLYMGKKKPLCQVFQHVVSKHIDHRSGTFACDTMEGTMKIHCIFAINKHVLTQLVVKPLSCLCVFCIDNRWIECSNVKWTRNWISKYLQPTNTIFVRESMYNAQDKEWQYGVDGEELAKSLEVGDNFVINEEKGNSEGQNFWLVCCTKPLHTLIHPLMCKWGIEYYEGDEVDVGKYYQKWGSFYSSYVLLEDSSVVYLY